MKRTPYISIKVRIKLYMKHRELDLKVKIDRPYMSEKLDILSTLNILIKLNNVHKQLQKSSLRLPCPKYKVISN